jgi:hypothetical protein
MARMKRVAESDSVAAALFILTKDPAHEAQGLIYKWEAI